ncbi:MAG: tRNA 2-thiouridine(34) synthase MnmA [Tepidimonas ignava]|uniref:tRNA-specific 2-thiouridylase MnmA n=1 Tax=Tepidimonas ignava TaxID=114249 RepID=A0A4R3LFQ9_9BURK|nr:tRNA 2-thiouridine(34) synthase MnmA [Tepidimonas ignava]MCX7814814.1 tRNA 2-thiouridine(34) synthase MnmA [Tepidimonas ignava]TCS98315.1 tRNA (5-methylaminomethyl-2-thiouridylate)-methyltransferase [Tepidimonas ignava]TSE21824.1 tRNA-specific 2-thiouridylase MnmA [Tepidimonas ignava]
MAKQRVVVGLSGGVDSAVSAYLLKQQGYEVVGIFMKNWEDDDDSEYCSSRQDWLDAASVADVIGIDVEHVNFAAEYKDRVFAEFLREYQAGRTPNPDILCNAEIKFKAFLDHAMRLGADKIATGHYARVRAVRARDGQPLTEGEVATLPPDQVRYQLLKGVDPGKDQSYFLHRLTQAQLARAIFPVGHLHKREVRRIAAEIGLPNARKKDSTGICFIGERPFREFLQRYLDGTPGPIVDEQGREIGRHVGLSFYTLGQRQGLGIGGVRGRDTDQRGAHAPWFVARKDPATHTLWAVQGHDHPWLQSRWLRAEDVSWIAGAAPAPGAYAAKTRYRQADAACTLELPGSGDGLVLRFAEPQWAVTPGQSAVLYDGEVCLGGGVIHSAEATERPLPAVVRPITRRRVHAR